VASIARDDPSPLLGIHREHNASACTASRSARHHALRVRARAVNLDRNLKPKLAKCASALPSQTDGQTDGH